MNRKQGYVQNDDELNKYLDNMKTNAANRGIRLLYCVATSPWVGTVTRACGTTSEREAEDCIGCMITDMLDTCDLNTLLALMGEYLLKRDRVAEAGLIAAAIMALEDHPAEEGDQ